MLWYFVVSCMSINRIIHDTTYSMILCTMEVLSYTSIICMILVYETTPHYTHTKKDRREYEAFRFCFMHMYPDSKVVHYNIPSNTKEN